MMYVPVELPGPNVQKPATSSPHSSYGKLSITPYLLSAPTP
jgi:hypothetical protein